MAEQPLPADLAGELREVKRRLAILERAPRLTNASITDGDDNDRVMLGELADGQFGIEVRDASGNVVFKVGELGLSRPVMNLPLRNVGDGWASTTSASFVSLWDMAFTQITADALLVRVQVSAPVGTSAEYRLYWAGTALASATQSIVGDGSVVELEWSWAPSGFAAFIGLFGATYIAVQARRTAGADPVQAYHPELAFMAPSDDIDATSTGV